MTCRVWMQSKCFLFFLPLKRCHNKKKSVHQRWQLRKWSMLHCQVMIFWALLKCRTHYQMTFLIQDWVFNIRAAFVTPSGCWIKPGGWGGLRGGAWLEPCPADFSEAGIQWTGQFAGPVHDTQRHTNIHNNSIQEATNPTSNQLVGLVKWVLTHVMHLLEMI